MLTEEDIPLMIEANQIVAETLKMLEQYAKPGMKTIELDKIAEDHIRSRGGRPAFKGYEMDGLVFPGTLCISIDEEIVHGIPGDRVLKEGEIVSIDCGCEKEGFFGDSAVTYAVGEISDDKRKLMKVTEEALMLGLEQAVAGNKVYDISRAVQQHVEAHGFSVTRELVGHGIGRKLHMEPPVPNFVPPLLHRANYPNMKLTENMAIAIEPMVHFGDKKVRSKADGWTVYTADGSPAAHFEHSVIIKKDKPIVLTIRN